MTLFLKNKNKYSVTSEDALDLHKELPAGVYSLMYSDLTGYYLEEMQPFSFKSKCYGSNQFHTDRIFNTFISRKKSTGVLLCGEKGSGKTLLSKTLSIKAHESGIPTILISSAFTGEEFNMLISGIEQPCMFVFDEFEKVYKEENDQNAILTLLDGVFNSKKLFVFTVNDLHKINNFMLNRPGRIFYKIKFGGLSEEFVREYCADNLRNHHFIDEILSISNVVRNFNFDMIQALVEEVDRYNESPLKLLEMLNITASSDYEKYEIVEFSLPQHSKNVLIPRQSERFVSVNMNSPTYEFYVDYNFINNDDPRNKAGESDYSEALFERGNVVSYNKESSSFVFKNDNGFTAKLRKVKEKEFNIFNFLV